MQTSMTCLRSPAPAAFALALGLGVFPMPLVAQTGAPAAPAHEDEAAYQSSIASAVAEFEVGHWEEARSLFERAHAIRPSARTERGLGMVAFELRHYTSSARLLEAALVNPQDPLTEGLRQSSLELLERAKAFIGRPVPRPTPADATLLVDGQTLALEPDGSWMLDAGTHVISAHAEGHVDTQITIDVKGGENALIEITLPPIVTAPEQVAAAAAPASSPTPAKAEQDEGGGVLTKWWFWTAAAVIVGGVVTGVVLATRDEPLAEPTQSSSGAVASALKVDF